MADFLKGDRNQNLASRGLHVPKHPARAESERRLWEDIENEPTLQRSYEHIRDFEHRRRHSSKMQRTSASITGGDVFSAIPRFYDPMEFWEISNLPWNIEDDSHRFRLYKWLDLFYRTHPLISILVDIFTRFPLVGMELECPDKKLKEFYEDVFFDKLMYDQFLVDLGREYWVWGQSFPLGSFNETFGVWEREELLDPHLVKVSQVPILGKTQYHLRPIPELVEIVKKKEPKEHWHNLQQNFPELIPYLAEGRDIPVSDVLLKQVAFKISPRDTHGTPILLRALRTLIHEEKLLASQDAIAERLYSPLILAKLGIPDLGDGQGPWFPSPMELDAFRDDLDYALSADFRVLVHHFGIDIQNVFGREQMPRLDQDFDRVDKRIMQVFGVNPSLLSGGTSMQPYASTALNAEFLNQILRTFQRYLIRHYESRAYIIAEAQEHYDYEKRGEERVPIMQEVIEYDEDGEPVPVKKNKLLIPQLKMKVLDLRDEATQRQFLFELKNTGVPIPDSSLAIGFDYDFEESLDRFEEEIIQKTIAQQEAKVKTYRILMAMGLPVPPELRLEIEGAGAAPESPGGPGMGGPAGPGGAPILMPPSPDLAGPGGAPPAGARDPFRGDVPEESHERTPPPVPGVEVGRPSGPGNPGGIISPTGPGAGFSSADEESRPILEELPRKKKKGNVIQERFKPFETESPEGPRDGTPPTDSEVGRPD